MLKRLHHPTLDYSRLTPYIFVGSNMCCQVHFEEELLAKGISVDISLEAERLDNPEGVKAFLWLPTKDHFAPSRAQLKLGVEMIEEPSIHLHSRQLTALRSFI